MAAPKNIYWEGLELGRRLWAARTHCKRGHKYIAENVYINPTSKARQCRQCMEITKPNCKKQSKEYMASAQRRYRLRNPEKIKRLYRVTNLKEFGLTIEDYDQMLLKQGEVCKICEKQCSSGKRLAVDHCHTTGKVRGLLCSRCNQGLGHFQDDSGRLLIAAAYLQNSKTIN